MAVPLYRRVLEVGATCTVRSLLPTCFQVPIQWISSLNTQSTQNMWTMWTTIQRRINQYKGLRGENMAGENMAGGSAAGKSAARERRGNGG